MCNCSRGTTVPACWIFGPAVASVEPAVDFSYFLRDYDVAELCDLDMAKKIYYCPLIVKSCEQHPPFVIGNVTGISFIQSTHKYKSQYDVIKSCNSSVPYYSVFTQ